ncbi:hypothetical protein C8P68_101473 [Mucilaginibacter yixingensis]|uniref:Uncharacterized protein n=1 Tax=Mucilaginibacter yixingensis TaxID=1295612 RepID=A0A2T5JFP6_9SPHI|nr:hypothetical protein C8P68_101473 [Mucilaginibacter yixingensis]
MTPEQKMRRAIERQNASLMIAYLIALLCTFLVMALI